MPDDQDKAPSIHNLSACEMDETQMTCDALFSLSSASNRCTHSNTDHYGENEDSDSQTKGNHCPKACTRQLQLPMFLSKTYHMIDRCERDIACWSESGENFVVKNVEKFASHVLPLYFKHSNFSSFARQLNFYGFRKLRSEPILTTDVDPNTASYVRFYHEKFQKDKPELLQQIKRATKTDQQSNKDDVDQLKHEMDMLKESLSKATAEYNRKISELSYECNRRITSMNAEFDKLAMLVQRAIGVVVTPASSSVSSASLAAQSSSSPPPQNTPLHVPDLLQSLSQAAMCLQNHLRQPQAAMFSEAAAADRKRSGPNDIDFANNKKHRSADW